ncbi:MAG: hypothetical protein FJZ16_10495 [Candidatus Omnitrophica bacterium]|nr:hypothetical protein [Candidatus Omnitrophota bacterium]
MGHIGQNEVAHFIRRKEHLRKKIQKDLLSLKIARESDIECCCYYHLRKFLKRDPRWKVFARRYAMRTGHYIDILIFHDAKPTIAMELKYDKNHIDIKDRKSLRSSVKSLGTGKAYFLATLVRTNPKYEPIKHKNRWESRRLIEIPVKLKMSKETLARWKRERKKLRKLL